MKGKSIFKVVLATIFVIAICTWIFPSTSFSTALVEGERVQVGIFDLFSYPTVAITYFGYIAIYVLAIAIFYGICNKIPAYEATVEAIKNKFAGKEIVFLVSVIALIAILVSVCGFGFGMMFVFPFIASIVLAMGYNKLVAATVTVGPVVAGLAGTTLGTQSVSYLGSLLGLNTKDDMISKIVVLLVFVIILSVNVILYAKKTKNNVVEAKVVEPKKEVKEVKKVETKKDEKVAAKKAPAKKASTTKTTKKTSTKKSTKTKASMAMSSDTIKVSKKQSIVPFVVIFDLILIISLVSVFDWSGLFNIDIFQKATESVTTFTIGDFAIFGKLLGNVSEWGAWTVAFELPILITVMSLILALVYRVKVNDIVDGIESGFKKAIMPIVTMTLAYVVLIIITYHPIQLTIDKAILEITSGFNVVTMTIVSIFASVFNVESAYAASSTIPYVTSLVTDTNLYPLIQIIFQSIYGLMMLVAPTSVVLIGTLSYLDIPYGQWLKHIWKVFVEVLVALLIIFVILLATV